MIHIIAFGLLGIVAVVVVLMSFYFRARWLDSKQQYAALMREVRILERKVMRHDA